MMLPPDPSVMPPGQPPMGPPPGAGGPPPMGGGGVPGFQTTDPMAVMQALTPLVAAQQQDQSMLAAMQQEATMQAIAQALGNAPNPAGYAAQTQPVLGSDPGVPQ